MVITRKAFLIINALIALAFIANTQQKAALPLSKNKLVVIAHRGDHMEVPENTLAAYEKAIELGADFIETDLRTTKDGQLVIMHDATVDRMTNGKGKIKDLNYKQVKELKVINKNKPGTTEYSIPTFTDVLNTCKGKIGIYLDFKDADPEKVFALIKEAGMERNVIVYLNKEEQYYQWKKAAPQIPLMSSPPGNAKDIAAFQQFLNKWNISILDGSSGEYNEEMLKTADANNVAIWLDVQSEDEGPVKWDKAIQQGVKGLQTDHPGKLIQYLKDKKLR